MDNNLNAVVTFDANDVYVNVQGSGVYTTSFLDIAVTGTVAPVTTPEPSAGALLFGGILALAGSLLLRRKRTISCSDSLLA